MRRDTSTHSVSLVSAAGRLLLGPDRCRHGDLPSSRFDPSGPTFLGANGSVSDDAYSGEFRGGAVPPTLSSSLLVG